MEGGGNTEQFRNLQESERYVIHVSGTKTLLSYHCYQHAISIAGKSDAVPRQVKNMSMNLSGHPQQKQKQKPLTGL